MATADLEWDEEAHNRHVRIRDFMAEQKAEADYLGMHVLDYMAQAHGGIPSDVVRKLKLHAEDHPNTCPPDCEMNASLERLKKKYRKQKPDA